MSDPRHIATDADDRLYVADTGNARIGIFNHRTGASPGQPAALILTAGLQSPRGLYVSPATGEIWVADDGLAGAVRYPAFDQLIAGAAASNATLRRHWAVPLAVVEDAWGDMFLADAAHRVVMYYPGLGADQCRQLPEPERPGARND